MNYCCEFHVPLCGVLLWTGTMAHKGKVVMPPLNYFPNLKLPQDNIICPFQGPAYSKWVQVDFFKKPNSSSLRLFQIGKMDCIGGRD